MHLGTVTYNIAKDRCPELIKNCTETGSRAWVRTTHRHVEVTLNAEQRRR